jgi:hypothetical protein
MSSPPSANERSEHPSDRTLGGYIHIHGRPPAFRGADGQPYTVSMETERLPNLETPCLGYLVFPRWAETGVGIVGHVETPVLVRGRRADVEQGLSELPLHRVKELLDQAITARDDASERDAAAPDAADWSPREPEG